MGYNSQDYPTKRNQRFSPPFHLRARNPRIYGDRKILHPGEIATVIIATAKKRLKCAGWMSKRRTGTDIVETHWSCVSTRIRSEYCLAYILRSFLRARYWSESHQYAPFLGKTCINGIGLFPLRSIMAVHR